MAEAMDIVTGAGGFTGSYVVKELLDEGRTVVATDLPPVLDSKAVREVWDAIGLDPRHPKLKLVGADLLDPGSLERVFEAGPSRVFHVASLYDYSAPLDKLRRINVGGTKNLLAIATREKLDRFVHWSTCGVFGKPFTAADGRKVNIPFDEESSSPKNTPHGTAEPEGTHLVNDYSVSKWEQEQLVWKAHRERDLPLTVVRPAPIYGPGSSYGHGGIILAIAQGLIPAVPLDAKNYITTSVHVEDIARFAVWAAARDETRGEDYNVVDDSIISYFEFTQYIALLCGRKMIELPMVRLDRGKPLFEAGARTWRFLETRFNVPRPRVFEVQSASYMSSSYWLSNRKTLAAGFEYKYPDVKEGLKDTIAWFRKMGWLTDRKRLYVVAPEGSKGGTDR